MSNHNLLSEEWCNLVFENRNKDYGAYQIRKNMGRRYFVALSSVFVGLSLVIGVGIGIHLLVLAQLEAAVEDLERQVPQLKAVEAEMGHEVMAVAGTRVRPPRPKMQEGTMQVPEIVEVTKNDIRFGIENDPDEEFEAIARAEFVEPVEEEDTVFVEERTDLPVAGPPLEPVEVVEQMPQFPGGITALMQWLDNHVVYPADCVRKKIGGELQVNFLVDIDGTLHDPKIVYSLHPDLDRAVLNAIRRMPRWQPGKVNGRIAVVCVTLPVHFQPR